MRLKSDTTSISTLALYAKVIETPGLTVWAHNTIRHAAGGREKTLHTSW